MPDALRAAGVAVVSLGGLWVLFALVRRARSGSGAKALRTAGMFVALFGWGHMRDPRNDTVAEAQDGRIRRDDASGDAPR